MSNIFATLLLILCLSTVEAFMRNANKRVLSIRSTSAFAVSEVNSGQNTYTIFFITVDTNQHRYFIVEALDKIVSSSGNTLVVVDYSTTWCGPCKMVFPKYQELSDRVNDVVFLKCIGDTSNEASALMKREGVRSVPAFHLWKNGARVDIINGARIEDVEAAVNSHK